MIFGNIIINGFMDNNIFNPRARDNSCEPFICLKDELKKYDIELNTSDVNKNNPISFEIHIDEQKIKHSKIPTFLLLYETNNTFPDNFSIDKKKYIKVYSWDDDLVSLEKYNKFNFPIPKNNNVNIPRFSERNGFCCAISGNKAPKRNIDKDLYAERIKLYKWFEKNAPYDFSLYGMGWHAPIRNGVYKNQILFHILDKFNYKPNQFSKIYKGSIESKFTALKKYKYVVCYENAVLNGYVTEKIFDSMFSGSIPIYWGAPNITRYIPKECFIDRRSFVDDASLYKFLKSIDEQQYIKYQRAINNFLESSAFQKFSSNYFARTIASDILNMVNDK
jgi:alpha(1,3/1,4) fucosyltransferase